ncbi:hypothetical protein MITS9509_00505 [Synechococcus sp. MIT S9509]|nr:hypothetical protein MITS9509_00505 [Synechococcus sp. MIT S9509]
MKGECLEILRGLAGMLLKDIGRQAAAGVVVTTLGADGQLLQQQVRNGIDPRAVSESGRCVERMAKLMGLMDGGIDAAGAATTAIQVTLPAPSAEAFMSPAPEPVDVASEPAESPSGGPEPAAANHPPIASRALISSLGLTSTYRLSCSSEAWPVKRLTVMSDAPD